MRIVYITAGAAGMYCGSCMRDNTLVAALTKAGHEALLVPTRAAVVFPKMPFETIGTIGDFGSPSGGRVESVFFTPRHPAAPPPVAEFSSPGYERKMVKKGSIIPGLAPP